MKTLSIILAFVFVCSGVVYGQRPNQRQNPQGGNAPNANGQGAIREIIAIKGTVEGSRGPILSVKGEDGRQFMVKAPEEPERVKFTGKGLVGMLQPGLFVRFEATFDGKGKAVAPVSNLEVFTPYRPRHAQAKDMMEMTPGLYPTGSGGGGGGGAGLFVDPSEKGAKRPAAMQTTTYRVIGQIAGISRKGVGINAGGRQVMVEITPEAQILVSDLGWNYAQPGDTVNVNGFYFPPNETQILAQDIQITGVNPLGAKQEKPKPGKKSPEKDGGKPPAEKGENPAGDAGAENGAAKPEK